MKRKQFSTPLSVMSSPKHDRSVENAIEEEEEEEEQNHLLKAEKNSQGATARRKGQGMNR